MSSGQKWGRAVEPQNLFRRRFFIHRFLASDGLDGLRLDYHFIFILHHSLAKRNIFPEVWQKPEGFIFFSLSVASIKMLIFCLHCSSSSLRSQMKQDQIKLFLSCLTDLRNQTPAPPNLFRARQIWRVIFCQKKFRCNWHLIRPSQTTRALITWLASCLSLHS